MCSTIIDDGADVPDVLNLQTVYEGWGRLHIARIRLNDGSKIEREVEDWHRRRGASLRS